MVCQVDKGGYFTTGGGFSDLFDTPSWQEDAVASYFANAETEGKTPYKGYNAGGRGIPDVALLGHDYAVALWEMIVPVSGTAGSVAVFAGMVSLVNAKRLAAGKSTLGWINPSLYAHADSFVNDITSGDNHCGWGLVCCEQGFTATAGWDPVSGLGSVNYTAFETAMFALGDNPNFPTPAPSVVPGQPTVRPHRDPRPDPSERPTGAPTLESGWIYANYHEEGECEGDVVRVEGWRLGQCFAGYSEEGEETGWYFMYTCNDSESPFYLFRL